MRLTGWAGPLARRTWWTTQETRHVCVEGPSWIHERRCCRDYWVGSNRGRSGRRAPTIAASMDALVPLSRSQSVQVIIQLVVRVTIIEFIFFLLTRQGLVKHRIDFCSMLQTSLCQFFSIWDDSTSMNQLFKTPAWTLDSSWFTAAHPAHPWWPVVVHVAGQVAAAPFRQCRGFGLRDFLGDILWLRLFLGRSLRLLWKLLRRSWRLCDQGWHRWS